VFDPPVVPAGRNISGLTESVTCVFGVGVGVGGGGGGGQGAFVVPLAVYPEAEPPHGSGGGGGESGGVVMRTLSHPTVLRRPLT